MSKFNAMSTVKVVLDVTCSSCSCYLVCNVKSFSLLSIHVTIVSGMEIVYKAVNSVHTVFRDC